MGFLAFILTIFINTIWLNWEIGILMTTIIVLILILLSSVNSKNKGEIKNFFTKNHIKKTAIISTIIASILGFLVVQIHIYIRGAEFLDLYRQHDTGYTKKLLQTPKWETFNGFVQVTDTQKWHTYLIKDENEQIRRLSSEQFYNLGDQIFLSASLLKRDENKVFDSGFNLYSFNYDKRLFMKEIDGTMYEKKAFILDKTDIKNQTMMGRTAGISKLSFIDSIRAKLQGYIQSVYGQNQYAGLLLGLLIGDKSLIPAESYDTFTQSGLVHIIAVSGGNIAMVVILLSFIFRRVPFYVRNGLIMLFVIFYAMICGGDSSVIRATIMASLTLVALFRGREVSIRRLMKYALIGILLLNPFYLAYDVGLRLSFGAVIGIILIDTGFKTLKSNLLKKYLLPTLGATLGTAPILLFFMKGVNLTGIILNIFVVAILPIITFYGFFSLLLSAIISRGGRIVPGIWLMKIIYLASEFGSNRAIFIVAKNEVGKYLLLGTGIIIAIISYIKFHKKTNLDSPSVTLSTPSIEP